MRQLNLQRLTLMTKDKDKDKDKDKIDTVIY